VGNTARKLPDGFHLLDLVKLRLKLLSLLFGLSALGDVAHDGQNAIRSLHLRGRQDHFAPEELAVFSSAEIFKVLRPFANGLMDPDQRFPDGVGRCSGGEPLDIQIHDLFPAVAEHFDGGAVEFNDFVPGNVIQQNGVLGRIENVSVAAFAFDKRLFAGFQLPGHGVKGLPQPADFPAGDAFGYPDIQIAVGHLLRSLFQLGNAVRNGASADEPGNDDGDAQKNGKQRQVAKQDAVGIGQDAFDGNADPNVQIRGLFACKLQFAIAENAPFAGDGPNVRGGMDVRPLLHLSEQLIIVRFPDVFFWLTGVVQNDSLMVQNYEAAFGRQSGTDQRLLVIFEHEAHDDDAVDGAAPVAKRMRDVESGMRCNPAVDVFPR